MRGTVSRAVHPQNHLRKQWALKKTKSLKVRNNMTEVSGQRKGTNEAVTINLSLKASI